MITFDEGLAQLRKEAELHLDTRDRAQALLHRKAQEVIDNWSQMQSAAIAVKASAGVITLASDKDFFDK